MNYLKVLNMRWLYVININWAWDEFGIGITIWKNAEVSKYKISIDIQIAFLDVWIQMFRRSD